MLLIFGLSLVCSCNIQSVKKMEEKEFIKEIQAIDSAIVDLTFEGALYKYDFFKEVSTHPQSYQEVSLAALSNPDLTQQQKTIIVLSMQKLPLEDFLRFSASALALLKEDKIPYFVFKKTVFAGYDWNTSLQENYDDPAVSSLISEILQTPQVEDSLKKYFTDYVLTGKAKEQVNGFY